MLLALPVSTVLVVACVPIQLEAILPNSAETHNASTATAADIFVGWGKRSEPQQH